jgi:hypothetical protein
MILWQPPWFTSLDISFVNKNVEHTTGGDCVEDEGITLPGGY